MLVTMTKTRSRTIDVYARVSRAGDKLQRSTAGQVADCKIRLEERGLVLGVVHKDEGRSAWNQAVRRPGWEAMMGRLESRQTDGVIVFDMARFSRRVKEGLRLIDAADAGMLVLDSDGEYDLTTSSGRKSFRDQLSSAEYESDKLSDRVKRGKKLQAMAGEPNGRPRSFGFETYPRTDEDGRKISDGVRPHPEESVILQEMVSRFLSGEPQQRIIDDLNSRQILTLAGKPWTRPGFQDALTRDINCGRIFYGGKLVGRLPFDPVISEADHDEVLARYAARRPGRPKSDAYLCSGSLICGLCGIKLSGRVRANQSVKPYADGEPNRQYFCCSTHPGGCGRIAVDQRAMDAAARELTIAVLSNEKVAAEIEAKAIEVTSEIASIDAAAGEIEELLETLAERLGSGKLTLARHDAACAPLEARLAVLMERRTALEASAVPGIPVDSEAAWEARWDAAEPTERRRLLRTALRGRMLIVGPADKADRRDVKRRLSLTPPPAAG